MSRNMKAGDIVLSIAGRDEDMVYMVVDRVDDRKVSIVDGLRRTLRRPKLKSVRHLRRIGHVQERTLLTRMQVGRVRDAEVRRALAEYNGETDSAGRCTEQRERLLEHMLSAEEEAGWRDEQKERGCGGS